MCASCDLSSSMCLCAGYSGDVWDEQPPSKDHPWHKFPIQAMTPHTSGTTLDAQVCTRFLCTTAFAGAVE